MRQRSRPKSVTNNSEGAPYILNPVVIEPNNYDETGNKIAYIIVETEEKLRRDRQKHFQFHRKSLSQTTMNLAKNYDDNSAIPAKMTDN